MKDDANKKVLGKFKDEISSLVMTELIALNPKVYSIKHLTAEQTIKNQKALKGVSKVVVKKDIAHDDYVKAVEKNEVIKKEVVSIRNFNHQSYTYKHSKIALNSWYDKMIMIDNIN